MAPAIREITQTLIERDTTFTNIVTLENTKPWPTLNLVTYTVTTPQTTVLRVIDTATSAPESNDSAKRSELSDGKKGAIAGSILGVVVFLLLLYYLYVCYFQRLSTGPPPKLPLDAKDLEASDSAPPQDPAPSDDKPTRKKKSVTISSDLPRYFHRYSSWKDAKPTITPVVRITTDMSLRTGLQTREGRLGQPVRFMIREREKPPRVKKRRRRRRRSKHKGARTDDAH
ncbi:hypothetical protein N7491_007595 [Penicillium cf. griseofulvum]|uniref:Mid2 domain-containing protein n=1 Tax=Penicillium cf. griseofulvum TaxID=2972120 RepID=A0A9W9M0E8_9EURO|nr:hypothetical protein N7472_009378 [Penicillium cf. griseofulvum]KAJ5430579.1 hypothetical protein N7491_007595 [Penicillium cf. griseofulvum]KAJ5435652.1 hypothetical protein N7445_006537 [Penicillium cf. griseofulvum]